MGIKEDIKDLKFVKLSDKYERPICDYCDNIAIGIYVDESDKFGYNHIDVCKNHLEESLVKK